MDCSWEEQLEQRFKRDRNLNFSTMPGAASDDDCNCQKKKISRDPMSHRIIEKRRRDRMNNCLADLSSLIPSNFLKKQGRGRIEKTEIIEMAIKHLKQLQAHHCRVPNGCPGGLTVGQPEEAIDHYCLGYQECLSETMHFLVEIQLCYPGDPLCVRIMNHLQKHRERVLKGRRSRSPSKESETGFTKRSTGSPDGSLFEGASPLPFYPSAQNRHSPTMEELPAEVTPKTEGSALFASADMSMKSSSDASDVQMSEPGDAKPLTNGHHPSAGSQLREMLQNPSLQLAGRGRSMSASGSSRPFSTASSAGSSTRGDAAEVFKYKRNIKERFKADQKVMKVNWDEGSRGSTVTEGATTDERRFSEPMLEVPPLDFQASIPRTLESLLTAAPGKCSLVDSLVLTTRPDRNPSPDPAPQFHASQKALPEAPFVAGSQNLRQASPQPPQDELPVFVLHPKGNFYVPMTIAAPLVQPYLNMVPDVVPQLLHHVGLAAFFWNSGSAKIAAGGPGSGDSLPRRCGSLHNHEMPPTLQTWSSVLGCT